MTTELTLALEDHRRGEFDRAARRYQTILAGDPAHADALHLLGVLCHQSGNHIGAVDLIGRAITQRPGIAAYHANLAEAYRSLGQFEDSMTSSATALRLDPDSPDALNGMGLTLLAQNRSGAATDYFARALHTRPDFALACNNLGNAYRLLGNKPEALSYFRRAIAIDRHLVEAHSNLGQLLLEDRQLDEALRHCQEAVRLRPHFAPAHSNLGNVLREMHRLSEAKVCYAEALRLIPELAMVMNNIAQTLQEDGVLDEAAQWYAHALERDPHSPRILTNLASLLVERERHSEAVRVYEQALQFDPTYAEAYNGLAWLNHEMGHHEQAQTLYREAIRLKPDLAAAHSNLGSVLEELNDPAGAEACFREALRHDSRLPGARAHLATMLRKKLPDTDLDAMRELLMDPYLSDAQRGCLHFGLAQVADARSEFAEAAEHLAQANSIVLAESVKHHRSYDPQAHTRFVDQLIEVFTPELFERCRELGSESERPVFVFGMPRSGTTLVEQILASHSMVFGAGELGLVREADEFVTNFAGAADLTDDHLREFLGKHASQYLARLHELNAKKVRVVDKMPDNYLSLGLLAVLFPHARFIHCRRDLRDVAVSCWITNFRHIRWANDIDHIAHRIEEYRRVMIHWQTVLPAQVLEVDYEDTVADLEGVAQRLVGWCGLEWEPACLAFHEGTRPVRTASVNQVRQPIYTNSVARWKHYTAPLAHLFHRFGTEL
jgi:tetratricopeptide (TPR) repeat protein